MQATLDATNGVNALAEYHAALSQAMQRVNETVAAVAGCEAPARALANATLFLDAFGHVVVAWLWLQQAAIAEQALAGDVGKDRAFYEGKLASCKFFFRYELPKADMQLRQVASLDDTAFAVDAAHFAVG